MWKVGDLVLLRFCDIPDNQEILNKPLKVVENSQATSPFWTEVECQGKRYSVRGAECQRTARENECDICFKAHYACRGHDKYEF